jgi:hypothetical protein
MTIQETLNTTLKLVNYDANPGDKISLPNLGVFTVARVNELSVRFRERVGNVSYFYLKLAKAAYLSDLEQKEWELFGRFAVNSTIQNTVSEIWIKYEAFNAEYCCYELNENTSKVDRSCSCFLAHFKHES